MGDLTAAGGGGVCLCVDAAWRPCDLLRGKGRMTLWEPEGDNPELQGRKSLPEPGRRKERNGNIIAGA